MKFLTWFYKHNPDVKEALNRRDEAVAELTESFARQDKAIAGLKNDIAQRDKALSHLNHAIDNAVNSTNKS